MGISGLIGGAAAQGLEELIAQQLEQAQLAEQVRRAKEAEAMQRRRASQDDTRIDLERQGLEQRERARRDASNRFGVEQMARDKETMDRDAEMSRRANVASSLATIEGLSPVQRMAAEENIRAGRGVNPNDMKTEAEIQAEADREFTNAKRKASMEADQDIRVNNARPRTGGQGGPNAQLTGAGAAENAADIARVASELLNHKGFNRVFGSIQGAVPSFTQESVDAEALRDTLISKLTLENVNKLKGVLSDRDMEVLQKASTSLRPRMGDAAARAEVQRLIQVMQRAAAGTQPMPSHDAAAPTTETPYETYLRRRGRW